MGQALSPAFPGFDQEQSDNNLQFAIGNVHTFSPTIVNELNIGFVRFRRERHSLDAFKRNWIEELGIKGLSPIPFTWAAPSMTPTGYSEIGYSSNNAVFSWVTTAGQIVDNFSFVRGVHTVKAGLTIQFKRMTTIQWGQPDGAYNVSASSALPCRFPPHLALMHWPTCFSDIPQAIQSRPLLFRHTCRIHTWAITYRMTGS